MATTAWSAVAQSPQAVALCLPTLRHALLEAQSAREGEGLWASDGAARSEGAQAGVDMRLADLLHTVFDAFLAAAPSAADRLPIVQLAGASLQILGMHPWTLSFRVALMLLWCCPYWEAYDQAENGPSAGRILSEDAAGRDDIRSALLQPKVLTLFLSRGSLLSYMQELHPAVITCLQASQGVQLTTAAAQVPQSLAAVTELGLQPRT